MTLRGVLSYLLVCLVAVLLVSVVSCGGGGGGGDGGGDVGSSAAGTSGVISQASPHAPSISNLVYSPSSAPVGNGTAHITGTLSFTDAGGDLSTMTFTAFDGSGNEIDGATLPIQNGSGHTSGTINWYANPSTSLAGNFSIQVFMTDAAGGNSNMLTFSFKVIGLGVSSTSPVNNAADVPSNTTITAVFNEDMDPSTITSSSFQVWTAPVSGTPTEIAGTVTYANRTATFTPAAALPMNTTFSAKITTGAQNLLGDALSSDCTWTFTVPGLLLPYTQAQTGLSVPYTVAISDITGDGRNDLVVATLDRTVTDFRLFAFRQNQDGTLASPLTVTGHGDGCSTPSTMDIGDLNSDGRNDIVVGAYGCGADRIHVFLQDSSGSFGPQITYSDRAFRVRIADVNHDGRSDLVSALDYGIEMRYQNAGGGLDAPVALSLSPRSVYDFDVADVNHDGRADIVVLHQYGINVFTQRPDSTMNPPVYYSIPTNGYYPASVTTGDVNGDGLKDVVATITGYTPNTKIAVFLQNASGGLDGPVIYDVDDGPGAVKIADLNGDSRLDVIVAHEISNRVGVLLQSADGGLRGEHQYATAGGYQASGGGLAVGDLNGDGRDDVAAVDTSGTGVTVLYQNPTP